MPTKAQRGAAKLQRVSEPTGVDWDDLRVFLACARERSFRKAAEALGLDSSTVARRIGRLEDGLQQKLFLRTLDGLALSEQGQQLVVHAEDMERAGFNLVRAATTAYDDETRGEVKVSVTEGLGTYWILPKLIDFKRLHPNLLIDFRCAMDAADVARLEADIAIQFTRPQNPDLVVTKLGRLHVYPFAAKHYADLYGLPDSLAAAMRDGHKLVMQSAPQLMVEQYARSLGVTSVEKFVSLRTNASSALLYAIERGAGIGLLPSYAIALGAPVVPVDMQFSHSMDLWLTYHPQIRDSAPHVRVIEWLRRIFDPRSNPAFRDEFIHPNELVGMMKEIGVSSSVRGFSAAMPLMTN